MEKQVISEGLLYHLDNRKPLNENIYRPESTNFFSLFKEARELYNNGEIEIMREDLFYIKELEIGEFAEYKGVKVPLDYPLTEDYLVELSEAAGKTPELNKPKRGGPKKFYVFVRNPKTKKIKKIAFGDTTGLKEKINNPEARKSFAARHKCSTKKDKMTAGYWSCRLPKFAKLLGLKSNFKGYW